MASEQDKALVGFLCEIERGLTDWEVEFVEDIARQVLDNGQPLSPGQKAKAFQIQAERQQDS